MDKDLNQLTVDEKPYNHDGKNEQKWDIYYCDGE